MNFEWVRSWLSDLPDRKLQTTTVYVIMQIHDLNARKHHLDVKQLFSWTTYFLTQSWQSHLSATTPTRNAPTPHRLDVLPVPVSYFFTSWSYHWNSSVPIPQTDMNENMLRFSSSAKKWDLILFFFAQLEDEMTMTMITTSMNEDEILLCGWMALMHILRAKKREGIKNALKR